MKRFEDKTILVTGAGSGIGAACVRRLFAEGASIVAAERHATTALPVGLAKVFDLLAHTRVSFPVRHLPSRSHLEFRSQLGLAHAAGSDDLQILLVAVEVRADLKPDPIGIRIAGGITRSGPAF